MKENTVIGFLAHVDAGKTTLTESILHSANKIKECGRVDRGTAFLDTDQFEKKRGITIYSKTASFDWELDGIKKHFTILDTPGHVDFSAEMERTISVLDMAVLIISAPEGIAAHTRTVYELTKKANLPIAVFINKTDQLIDSDPESIIDELNRTFDESFVNFKLSEETLFSELAGLSENAMNEYLEKDTISKETIQLDIKNRNVVPCLYGSALKEEGITNLLDVLTSYFESSYSEKEDILEEKHISGRVYKITHDGNTRLTFLKLTAGVLRVKDLLEGEKVNQIRIYDGTNFEAVSELYPGQIAAVTGPEQTYAGQGIGDEPEHVTPTLKPVLRYRILLPDAEPARVFLPKLRILEEEDPTLSVVWQEEGETLEVDIMGEIQLEILKSTIFERFGVDVTFDEGSILYKETLKYPTYGMGHFEPLRHYAEVHFLIEPAPRNSGITLKNDVTTNELDRSWQKTILSAVSEEVLRGVLIKAELTDVRITLAAGRAHVKHTEGGDFREAALRAIRQGLMCGVSTLLEPYYSFLISVPQENIGRVMMDMETLHGTCEISNQKGTMAILTGRAPVSTIRNYQAVLLGFTKGKGTIALKSDGYDICHNREEILANSTYNPEIDLKNPCGSVFVSHGAGFYAGWMDCMSLMHLESRFGRYYDIYDPEEEEDTEPVRKPTKLEETLLAIGTDEIDTILSRQSANKKKDPLQKDRRYHHTTRKVSSVESSRSGTPLKVTAQLQKYLLVDGYNIIHAWKNLSELIDINIDGARGALLDIMCNYQAMKGMEVIVVFDAYKVQGHRTEIEDYHNIHVVYTKQAETADMYISRFTNENGKKYDITVATSDFLIQLIIRGAGCRLMSARDLEYEVTETEKAIRENYLNKTVSIGTNIGELEDK